MKFLVGLLLLTGAAKAQVCFNEDEGLSLAGADSLVPLVTAWAERYVEICPQNEVVVEGGGSVDGVIRVCNEDSEQDPVHIGLMSRNWLPGEGNTDNEWYFTCNSASGRPVIQIPVAIDALAIGVKRGGVAHQCIEKLGGLTLDQLRWIYTGFSMDELIASGWDEASVPNIQDEDIRGNETVRLWSALHRDCADEEILIGGAAADEENRDFFAGHLFLDGEEEYDRDGYFDFDYLNLVAFLEDNETAISYFSYADAANHFADIYPVPILNFDGDYITPSDMSISSGTYAPLSRMLYFNVLDQENSLEKASQFISWALSDEGEMITKRDVGFVPVSMSTKIVSLTRLQAEGGVPWESIDCGPDGGYISIAGSTTVYPVVNLWAGVYQVMCQNIDIVVEGGGTVVGAQRICADNDDPMAVDIGGMSRDFKDFEATRRQNGYEYDCPGSDGSVIQVDIGVDALTLAVKNEGTAFSCINKLGGLTVDQIRWIYSSYNEDDLEANEWDRSSVPNSDGDPSTHLWSELHSECHPVEIKISGPDALSGTYDFFREIVFRGDSEAIATARPDGYAHSLDFYMLADYLFENDEAISFHGFNFVHDNFDILAPVPIQDPAGEFVTASAQSLDDGSYAPFARRININLYNDEESLANTRPFLEFGLSHEGSRLIKSLGYAPIPPSEKVLMKSRAQTETGIPLGDITPYCGHPGVSDEISIGGSTPSAPLVSLLTEIYGIGCPNDFEVFETGHNDGTARVCGDLTSGSPVDIGTTTRDWKPSESFQSQGFLNQCRIGNTQRSAIKVDMAIDALAITTSFGGEAEECIQILGGLTIHQLRWIFSSYTEEQLFQTGWDPSSLKNGDNNPDSHKWSELDSRCADEEIMLIGAAYKSSSFNFFREIVFKDHGGGENFDNRRPMNSYMDSDEEQVTLAELLNNGRAIAYFPYTYYMANFDRLAPAAIRNDDGDYTVPDEDTVGRGSYPLSRTIYMNLLNEEESLQKTAPFVSFALSSAGTEIVRAADLTPLPPQGLNQMVQRLNDGQPYEITIADFGGSERGSGAAKQLSAGAVVGIVLGSIAGLIIIVGLFTIVRRRIATRKEKDDACYPGRAQEEPYQDEVGFQDEVPPESAPPQRTDSNENLEKELDNIIIC